MRLASSRNGIVVTGLGFVAPGLAGGRSEAALLRAQLLTAGDLRPEGTERRASDFDAAALLGPKGLRHLSRGTLSLMSASLLALRDAGLSGDDLEQAGVAAGTATAAAAIVADFDRTTLAEGPQAPNPALFPQIVWNGPASQVSIRNGLRGPNFTVSSGLNSGLDAVIAASRVLGLGGARAFLAGGFEELSSYFRVIFPGGSLERAPVPLCEGAAVLVLEEAESAMSRGARPLAAIRAWGSDCSPRGGIQGDLMGPETLSEVHRLEIRPSGASGKPEHVSRHWRHAIPGDGDPAPAGSMSIVEWLGCGGGFTGALAALLAAAPGAGGPGDGTGSRELVTATDGRGRRSALLLERAR